MIHPSAVIAPGAVIGADVEIGPYAVIDEHVKLGDGCRVYPHAYITGHTTIGSKTVIHSGAVIGDVPQDLSYDDSQPSYTDIGSGCTIREYATIHRGNKAGSRTVIGNNVLLMGFVHIAHNCVLEDSVIIANASLLAGHVTVGTRAFISGGVLIQQFSRIGTVAMISGGERVVKDVPPYCTLALGVIHGPNTIGLRRAGFSPVTRAAIRGAVKIYFFSGLNRMSALERIRAEHGEVPEVKFFADFIAESHRGIMSGKRQKRASADSAEAGENDDGAED